MASPAHLFEIKTINVGDSPPMRATAHCYKGLGAFRIDPIAPNFFQGKEVWSITVLCSQTLFPVVPVFHNIDDACGFIWDVSTLFPWERRFTVQELRAIFKPLSRMLSHYNAYPFDLVLEAILPEDIKAKYLIPIPSETIQ